MGFKPGFDANRAVHNDGIMQFHKQLAALLREQSLDAIKLLTDTMNDTKVSAKLRVICAKDILDRSHGRPIDTQVMVAIGNESVKDVSAMTDSELESLARTLAPGPINQADNDAIEGEYTKSES